VKTRSILTAVLVVVAALAVWQFTTKRHLLSPDRLSDSWNELTGQDVEVSAPRQNELTSELESEDIWTTPTADPVPEIRMATADEMFPFRADEPLLDSPVQLPQRRAPIVYSAFCGTSDDIFTTASRYFGEFYKYQLLSHGEGPLLANLIPNKDLWLPYQRSYKDIIEQLPYEKYLADAKELGSDFLFYPIYDGGTTSGKVTIQLVDLRSSRTETWSSEQAGLTSPHDIIIGAAEASMKFLGFSPQEIAIAKTKEGAPSDTTFAWAVSNDIKDREYEDYLKILALDPDCRYLYAESSGTTWVGQLNNLGLRRFHNDSRLAIRKAGLLKDAQSTEVLVRYMSALIRRYPENFYNYTSMAENLAAVYSTEKEAKDTPPVFKAMIKQQQIVGKRYPEFYPLHWNSAYALNRLASYIRGGNTVDKIPEYTWSERRGYVKRAYQIMTDLVDKHATNAALLRAYIYYESDAGAFSKFEERSYIRRIATLDPREVDIELSVAGNHSIGYGNSYDYFAIMDRALLSHKGDAEAIRDLANAVQHELYRQVGWKKLTDAEARTTNNPYGKRFAQAAEFVYSKGKNLGFQGDWAYYVIVATEEPSKLKKWEESGQNSYYSAKLAAEAYEANDWERSIKFVRHALPHLDSDDKGHMVRYYGVKSLWKLKRYDESLKLARESIFEFPNRQTFPYMYAVVASEADKDLETAFDCAWRAVDLGTDNQGCNDTFEKLRNKLNKPNHPMLAALKN